MRYPRSGYRYTYLVFDLYHDDRERLRIRNWYDSEAGTSFCAQLGDALIMIMPSQDGVRQQLEISDPTDLQLFQVTEIFKAGRDSNEARFFEIYDQLEEPLKRQPLIARLAVLLSYEMQEQDRYEAAMGIFLEIYGRDPAYSMVFADYYLFVGMFEARWPSSTCFAAACRSTTVQHPRVCLRQHWRSGKTRKPKSTLLWRQPWNRRWSSVGGRCSGRVHVLATLRAALKR